MNCKIKIVLVAFLMVAVAACPAPTYSADETKPVDTAAPEASPVAAPGQPDQVSSEPAPSVPEATTQPAPETVQPAQVPATIVSFKDSPEKEAAPIDTGNITVNFKGADIRTVLAYLSEVSGIDIVPSPDVTGTVDLKLTDKSWQVALDLIVRNYGFAYEREGNIIRVVTVDRLKQEELKTQTFSLNYGKAKDISVSIKEMVSSRGKIMFDERTNIVLVTDIPTNIYNIGQIIEKLDKMTSQVLIEARIIETLLDDSEKLGIDWNIYMSIAGAKRPTTFPFNYFKAPFNSETIHGKMESYFPQTSAGTGSTVIGSGGATTTTAASEFPTTMNGVFGFPFAMKDDFTFGTIDFSKFSAILEAFKERRDTDIISNPRIATLDNNEAVINVGQTYNFPKFERNSTTGRMEITGYEPKDLGIILKVTPHINSKDEIVVDLSPEISSFEGMQQLDPVTGVVAPIFNVRNAKTQVRIRDGEIIFIGGLIREDDIYVNKPMPIIGELLGEVPGLGLLFTKKTKIKQKKELIFFISVNLILPGKEIKDVPLASNARIPTFALTQGQDPASKKKQKKRLGK